VAKIQDYFWGMELLEIERKNWKFGETYGRKDIG
jgi:hypothetical protein